MDTCMRMCMHYTHHLHTCITYTHHTHTHIYIYRRTNQSMHPYLNSRLALIKLPTWFLNPSFKKRHKTNAFSCCNIFIQAEAWVGSDKHTTFSNMSIFRFRCRKNWKLKKTKLSIFFRLMNYVEDFPTSHFMTFQKTFIKTYQNHQMNLGMNKRVSIHKFKYFQRFTKTLKISNGKHQNPRGNHCFENCKFTIPDPQRLRVTNYICCHFATISNQLKLHLGFTVQPDFRLTRFYTRFPMTNFCVKTYWKTHRTSTKIHFAQNL